MIKYFEVKNKSNRILRETIKVKYTNKKSPSFTLCHVFLGDRFEYNSIFVRIAKSLEEQMTYYIAMSKNVYSSVK